MLKRDNELVAEVGFEPGEIPHYSTFATQWWEHYRHDFREHTQFEAAEAALKCRQYNLVISEKAEEPIDEFDCRDTGEDHDIPEKYRLENEERDRIFNEFRNLFNDLPDRTRDLLNIKTVYDDSEFAAKRICSYITYCGLG